MYRARRFARDWNKLGEQNPYGAILTGGSGKPEYWDPDAFFATGRADVERFMDSLTRIVPDVGRRRALDFGCGVGRIAHWLATYFESVVAVDVAPAMIEKARTLNAYVRNCEFLVNREPQLTRFETEGFDVIYCRLVLQHVPPALIEEYVPELIRVLSPGGALMFQLPEEIDAPFKSFLNAPILGGSVKRALPRVLVRGYRVMKYVYLTATCGPRMRMFGIPFDEICCLIRRSGGRLLEAVPDMSHGIPTVRGFEYWVTKDR
jgi:SAM-dependent methyltransferase